MLQRNYDHEIFPYFGASEFCRKTLLLVWLQKIIKNETPEMDKNAKCVTFVTLFDNIT